MGKAKILLVEDSDVQGAAAKRFLERSGYEAVWVRDGRSGIEAAKKQGVDLVLLDLQLPDIDGHEVTRWLRVDAETRGIPIIMLTVKDSVDDKVAGLESGADDYLAKPFNEIELNARIYACLRTKSLQDELRGKNDQLEDLLGRVEYLAVRDPLTDLFNRRRFDVVLQEEFKKVQRYGNSLSCLVADIDRFKSVNDEHGHQAGDVVLKEVARLIASNIRDVDIAARWGGEEFIVLCVHTDKRAAVHVANRVLRSLRTHAMPGMPAVGITLSIGIAGVPDDGIDGPDQLVHAADAAMYRAKEEGGDRAVLG